MGRSQLSCQATQGKSISIGSKLPLYGIAPDALFDPLLGEFLYGQSGPTTTGFQLAFGRRGELHVQNGTLALQEPSKWFGVIIAGEDLRSSLLDQIEGGLSLDLADVRDFILSRAFWSSCSHGLK